MIEPVVIGAVRLGVIRRSEDGHLVAVDGVVTEKELHFVGNLFRRAAVFPETNKMKAMLHLY